MNNNQTFRSKTLHSRIKGPSSIMVLPLNLEAESNTLFRNAEKTPPPPPPTTQHHVPDDSDFKTKIISLFAEEK
jgi:hypothetical protein